MARLIQKTGFISRKSAGGYIKYIATREGVEVLNGKGPTTEKQKELVAKLLKDFPDVRDSFEYEDYKQAPTLHTASALISAALDSHMQNLQSENGYLRYIAMRPGAEKHGAHGLFGRQENTDLTAAMAAGAGTLQKRRMQHTERIRSKSNSILLRLFAKRICRRLPAEDPRRNARSHPQYVW